MSNIFETFFPYAWNVTHAWIKIILAILIFISIIGAILLKGIKNFCNFIWETGRNIYFFVKLGFSMWSEKNRLQTLINWKKNQSKNKNNYESKSVEIRNVYITDEEGAFIKAAKKGYIVVIRKKIDKDSSKNLLQSVIYWVTVDYLAGIRKYISPELAMALIYKEIICELRDMKDYQAEKSFIEGMSTDAKVKQYMEKIDDLHVEGIYDNIYLPYLRNMLLMNNVLPQESKKESVDLLMWLDDYNNRLLHVTKFKYFPSTSFLYVRIPNKDVGIHRTRALNKFEKESVDVLLISGWIAQKSSAAYIAHNLTYDYKYFFIKEFAGKRLRHQIDGSNSFYENRINFIVVKKHDLKSLFN